MCRARLRAVRACALVRRKPGSHARQARAIGVQVEILGQGQQFDVLVVDDSSPDGTGDLVAHMAALTPRVQLIRRAGKLGLGTAYVAGFAEGLRQGYRSSSPTASPASRRCRSGSCGRPPRWCCGCAARQTHTSACGWPVKFKEREPKIEDEG